MVAKGAPLPLRLRFAHHNHTEIFSECNIQTKNLIPHLCDWLDRAKQRRSGSGAHFDSRGS